MNFLLFMTIGKFLRTKQRVVNNSYFQPISLSLLKISTKYVIFSLDAFIARLDLFFGYHQKQLLTPLNLNEYQI